YPSGGMRKVLLCAGKVYYDLLAHREANNITDVAIVRIERLYPLPARSLPPTIAGYPDAEVMWVQEEPMNQGAWSFMAMHLPQLIERPVTAVARPASSSPAVGAHHRHDAEQKAIVEAAFA
ncbi:MAG: hypothetical protein ACR2JS_01295, partial [Candidatus Nanopelagicales bacterium]